MNELPAAPTRSVIVRLEARAHKVMDRALVLRKGFGEHEDAPHPSALEIVAMSRTAARLAADVESAGLGTEPVAAASALKDAADKLARTRENDDHERWWMAQSVYGRAVETWCAISLTGRDPDSPGTIG